MLLEDQSQKDKSLGFLKTEWMHLPEKFTKKNEFNLSTETLLQSLEAGPGEAAYDQIFASKSKT